MSHIQVVIHEPAANLSDLIMRKIVMEERKRAFRGVSIFSIFSVISLGGSFSLGEYFWNAIHASGFLQFASLSFSDWSVVASHASSFFLSLAESFPVIELAIFLAAVVAAVWSVSYLFVDFKIIRSRQLLLTA